MIEGQVKKIEESERMFATLQAEHSNVCDVVQNQELALGELNLKLQEKVNLLQQYEEKLLETEKLAAQHHTENAKLQEQVQEHELRNAALHQESSPEANGGGPA